MILEKKFDLEMLAEHIKDKYLLSYCNFFECPNCRFQWMTLTIENIQGQSTFERCPRCKTSELDISNQKYLGD